MQLHSLLSASALLAISAASTGCGNSNASSQHAGATTPRTVTVVRTVTSTLPTLNQVLKHKVAATSSSHTIPPLPPPPPPTPDGSDTSLTTYTDDGAIVEFDDGSVWSVDDPSTVSGWSDGDAITTNDAGDTLVDTDTGDSTTATQIGSMTDQNSYLDTGDHNLQATGDDGSILTLEDGSVWAINDAYDQTTVQGWTDSDSIVVRDDGDGTYTIVDTDDQSSVTANYVGTA